MYVHFCLGSSTLISKQNFHETLALVVKECVLNVYYLLNELHIKLY